MTNEEVRNEEATKTRGYLMLLVGDERATSDAALGIALRGAGHSLRVHIIEFLKTGRERGEVVGVSLLTGASLSQYGRVVPQETSEDVDGPGITPERLEAALNEARAHINQRVVNILILDGLLTLVDEGMVEESTIIEMVDRAAPWLDIVVTGRRVPRALQEVADSVTVMETRRAERGAAEPLRRGIHY